MWERLSDRFRPWLVHLKYVFLVSLAIMAIFSTRVLMEVPAVDDSAGEPRFSRVISYPDFISGAGQGSTANSEQDSIKVSITGAVDNSGVFDLSQGAILAELLDKAVVSSAADKVYVAQQLNLARELVAAEHVYVPFAEEREFASSGTGNASGVGAGQSSANSQNGDNIGLVNLNTASSAQLETLPGVGPATAERIISGRPYRQIADILDVSGIGPATLANIEELVTI